MKKHLTLYGRVMEVEPSGVLQVDHYPIWSLLRRHPSPLPVKIDSIETKGLSTAWLQTVMKGEDIEFQPIFVENNSLSCIVIRKVSPIFSTEYEIEISIDFDLLISRTYDMIFF